MSTRLAIVRLGAQGDGVVETERGPVFVPYALPGETVTAAIERDRATIMAVIDPSPLRVEPACRHFTVCGGCALQHLEETAYRAWKRDKVVQALSQFGIDAPVAELVPCAPHSRRRVVLAARRTELKMLLGYHRPLSPEIVDIVEDPIARPEIVAAHDAIRGVATLLANTAKAFRIAVTSTDSGLDIALHESGKVEDGARRAASDFAIRAGFARLSVDLDIIVEPRKPVVLFGGVAVNPPPASFLQAVASTEEAMAELAVAHLGGAKRIADLFSGCGTFALRLARRSLVHAVEADGPSLLALDQAYRYGSGLKTVTGERRDIFRRPLPFKELDAFDGVLFDPPRAGAEDQAKQLARSSVSKVVAVSCNPTTLGRDLAVLVAGGYRLTSVTPLDQFLWSPHVEIVACLEKTRKRKRA